MRNAWSIKGGCGQCVLSLIVVVVLVVSLSATAFAQSPNLAPGFDALPRNARVVVMPLDIELFSISAGGVLEPKADWTEDALKHFRTALVAKKKSLGVEVVELGERDADEFAELIALHAAIASAIANHHFGPGYLKLPTKEGRLDWSLGDHVRAIKEWSGADYALFCWIRDSYASVGRVAEMLAVRVGMLLGVGQFVGPGGGMQTGYASLVELDTGRIVWFNRLAREKGDLRDAERAGETLNALLTRFPEPR